jgi:adenylate cyclase
MKRKPGTRLRQRVIRGLLVGAGAFALALLLQGTKAARPLEWKSWDLRLRLFSEPSRASRDIAIFLVDQYSLDVYAKQQGLSWPWPRQVYSAVVDYLRVGGAKAVFFDLSFSETSRSGVEDDEDLARAMRRSGNVFLPLALSQEEESYEEGPADLLERFAVPAEELPRKSFPQAVSATPPVPVLLEASRGVGNVLFRPDSDGIFRRLPLAISYRGFFLPSVPLALAREVRGGKTPPGIPVDETGRMIIRYYGPAETYRSYPIAAVINSYAQLEEGQKPQIPPREFAGKIVLIGGSAPGLLDLRPTPLSPVYPGVEIQATVLDNLLKADFIRTPPRSVVVVLLLFFGLLTAVGASVLRRIWQIVAFFVVSLALPFGAAWLAFSSGAWLALVVPEFAVLTGFIGASLVNYGVEGRQRRFIKGVFRHYLSPDVIERIIENPSLLSLGGEKREITSFFSDLAGFTSISESLSPEDLVELLNDFLGEMTDIILASGGTLDKYEGDAIIAFWNAPLDQPDHALRACRAALACQRRLAELAGRFEKKIGRPLSMRIGLNSGPAVVGNMGSTGRFDYTAMGDTVNLASRLEGACKQYQVPILVGEETFVRVREEMAAREVDTIRVIGKKKPVSVYEVIGEKIEVSEGDRRRLGVFERAREAYLRRDWDGAAALFGELGEDPPARAYVARCQSLKQAPPPPDWDGVFELKQK